jgi:MFS family permease
VSAAGPAAAPSGPLPTFASLGIRNFRLFFWGQFVSVSGTWLQGTAQAWLVLKVLDGGAGALGLLSGLMMAPTLLFGLWVGVLADRYDRRKLVMATNTWAALMAGLLAVLTLTGAIRLWMVFVIAFGTGLANAVEMPTRQAFVSELVPQSHVQNAVGLNSATFNGGRVFGPAVAGLLILLVGTGWCFAINAASFVAVLIGLARMRRAEMHTRPLAPRAKGQIREGLRYAWSSPILLSTLVLVLIVGLFTLNFQVFLPLMAKEVFGGGAGLVGVFSAMQGAGALVSSLVSARRSSFTPSLLATSAASCGSALIGMALAPWLWLELLLVAASGAGFIAMMLTANATLQLNSAPDKRGRVMALYVLMFGGTTPFGSPLLGYISDRFGARTGTAFAGAAALGAAALLPVVRRAAERRVEAAAVPAPSLTA